MKSAPSHFIGFMLALATCSAAHAAQCREGFDHVGSLEPHGWLTRNNSEPLGTSGWFQGNPGLFAAYSGAPNSYVAADLDSAGSSGYPVLSNWLITPEIAFGAGSAFSFHTRALPGAANRVVVRLCIKSGATTCAAPGPASGDRGGFTTDLLDINPEQTASGYPTTWTYYQLGQADGLPAGSVGRIAFHYYGFWQPGVGLGSAIGLDDVGITGTSGCPLAGVLFADGFE